VRRCRLRPEALKNASEWLAYYQRFWTESLDSLGRYLDGLEEEKAERKTSDKEDDK
jgi:hypothetical protein